MFTQILRVGVLWLACYLGYMASADASFCSTRQGKGWEGKNINVYVAGGHSFAGKVVAMTDSELTLDLPQNVGEYTPGGVVRTSVFMWRSWISCDDVVTVTWSDEPAAGEPPKP